MSRRRNQYYSPNNSFWNKIKDYIIPIVWCVLIIFLVYFCFKKPVNNPKIEENQTGITITKTTEDSAIITYLNGTKKDIEGVNTLYKTEKITVWNWNIKLSNEDVSFNLNKLWELSYLENWNFSLQSGELWVDSNSEVVVEMRFAKVKIHWNSHVSLSQNEVNSSIYVVSGTAEVSNLVWKNTILVWNEKIDISRGDASLEKVDFSLKKEPLNEYFLKSNWFILNKWAEFMASTWATEEAKTWETSTWNTESKWFSATWPSKYLTFSNLLDESNVSSSVISISWYYDKDEVSKIEVNWITAVLDSKLWSFKIDWVSVWEKENNLVFKVFDLNEDLLEKTLFTVYNDLATNRQTIQNQIQNQAETTANVFSVDWSKFAFTAPTSATTYTTYETFVTIRWLVSAPNIDKVTVNGFSLKSFNWKTWRYHANMDYQTLSNWTNIYKIKYYSGNTLVYENFFTIIKKEGSSTVSWTESRVLNTSSTQAESKKTTTENLELDSTVSE